MMLAAAAAAGLTTAAALPASASTSNYFEIAVQTGTNAPVMCLQPFNPAGGAGEVIVWDDGTSPNRDEERSMANALDAGHSAFWLDGPS